MAKSHLNIASAETSQDARLELLINAASQRMETMTDRALKSRSHVELRSGRRSNIITLKQWPVTAISQVNVDNDNLFGATTIVDPSKYAICDEENSVVLLNDYFDVGFNNVRIAYTAGYNSTDHVGQLADLEVVCMWMVEWFYRHRERGDMGRTSKTKGDETVGILAEMPPMIKEALLEYKRTDLPLIDRPISNL
jgi:uncharacterized phiE125 gp8 family phage protein